MEFGEATISEESRLGGGGRTMRGFKYQLESIRPPIIAIVGMMEYVVPPAVIYVSETWVLKVWKGGG